jgi:ribosome-associated heat shock protein Hsp15
MASAASQRLDKWLWHARVVRTRTSASKLIEGGLVRVNSARTVQPAHLVKAGDVLTVALDARVRVLRIDGVAPRRGDATAARALYAELN